MTHVFETTEFHNLKVQEEGLVDNTAHRSLDKYTYMDSHKKEKYMIITDNKSASIIEKTMQKCKQEKLKRFDTSVLQIMPLG